MLSTHLTVTVYSHHFEVSKLTPRGREFCMAFTKQFLAWGFRQERGRGVRYIAKVYAAANDRRSYYRYHINKLEDFKAKLIEVGLNDSLVEWAVGPDFTPAKVEFKVKDIWTAREDQKPYIEYLCKDKPVSKLVGIQTGKGKSLPLSAKVKVPLGWKKMGDIKVGDLVTCPDGTHAPVDGVYPQGIKQAMAVVFEDGREVTCCPEHLWEVRVYTLGHTYRESRILDTISLFKLLAQRQAIYKVRLIKPPEEGYNDSPDGVAVAALNSGKSISPRFLEATPTVRRALMASIIGLIGKFLPHGEIALQTKRKDLLTYARKLCWSLGGICRIDLAEYGEHVVLMTFSDYEGLIPPSPQSRRRKLKCEEIKADGVRILRIEPRESAEMQCISVDHPEHLYITDNYIATHNTFCALQAVANIGLRCAIFVKSMYIDKWVSDILKTYDIDKKRIMVIEGNASLMALFAKAKEGTLDADFLVFSISTVQRWFDLYESMGEYTRETGYDSTPLTWFNDLGIGVDLVDEVHQHFHAMFKLCLYKHVKYSIALSATLLHKDAFMEAMYDVMFPRVDRPVEMALDRYAHACAVHYNFINPTKIRTTEFGSNNYSHNALEKSVMSNPETEKNYFRMIDELLILGYFNNPKEKKSVAVFASTIEMCTRLTAHFKRKYPHLDIRRYVGDDPYENAIEADVRFTTVGSMGTAIDVPNLVCVILTQALSSVQANIQVLGRLRKIEGERVEFLFLTSDNINKHVDYYKEKREMLQNRAASFKEIFMGHGI